MNAPTLEQLIWRAVRAYPHTSAYTLIVLVVLVILEAVAQ